MDGADPYSDGILKTPIVIDNVRSPFSDPVTYEKRILDLILLLFRVPE